MGHLVDVFDHKEAASALGRSQATEALADKIRTGHYDCVFYQTGGPVEAIDTAALREASRRTCIIAWNSDDDWDWERTSKLAADFSFMVTTYPTIHDMNRHDFPNLLLSQWAASEAFGEYGRQKDIDVSFVGTIYGVRSRQIRELRRHMDIKVFGRGARLARAGMPYFRGLLKIPVLVEKPIESLLQVYELYSRSRISFTPLNGGPDGTHMQIKGRVFEQGVCGTLMLCQHSPFLERYYDPGRECVTFEDLADAAQKAKWYLSHESARLAIAQRYMERTLSEHLWRHRFTSIFERVGLSHS